MKKLIKVFACLAMILSMIRINSIVKAATIVEDGGTIVAKVATTALVNQDKLANYTLHLNTDTTVTIGDTTYYGTKVNLQVNETGYVTLSYDALNVSESANGLASSDCLELYKGDTLVKTIDELIRTEDFATVTYKLDKGTYTLVLRRKGETTSSNYTPADTDKVNISAYVYASGDKTLENGKWQAIAGKTSNARYYKIVTKSAGNVVIQSDKDMDFTLCKKDKTKKYKQEALYADNNRKVMYYLPAGTYYIKTSGMTSYGEAMVTSASSGVGSRIKYTYRGLGNTNNYVNTASKTVYINPSKDATSYTLVKYVAPSTGYLKVTALKVDNQGSCDVRLLNASKSAVSNYALLNVKDTEYNKVCFGVKKGRTYFIKVRNSYSDKLKLRFTTTAIIEKSGSSKKMAVSIPSASTKKGIVIAGDGTSDWYKFKLSEKRYLKLRCNYGFSDDIDVQVYHPDGSMAVHMMASSNGTMTKKTSFKLKKGTYYIRVKRGSKNASGWYSLYWTSMK